MDKQTFLSAHDQILGATLPPATAFFALRLLRMAHESGTLCLEWEEILNLAGVSNRGSVRRHLIALKQAEIIRYATNGHILLSFCAYGACGPAPDPVPMDTGERRNPRVDARNPEHEPGQLETTARGNACLGARPPARIRADSPPTPPYVCLSMNDTDPETNKHVPADLEPTAPEPTIDTTEQQRSAQLLTDPEIGIAPDIAIKFAAIHQFDWLERQVFAYLNDLANHRVSGPAALINRIRRRWHPGQLTENDRASELYARHHDLAEERRRRYIPAEYADVIVH